MARERVENDAYYTPRRTRVLRSPQNREMSALLAERLLEIVDILGSAIEPCCGDGAISNVLLEQESITKVIQTDITKNINAPKDATTGEYWQFWGNKDWVVTNPPFKDAHKILPLALQHSNKGVAFLLRLSYIEPTKNRGDWLIENSDCLRYFIPINPRPKFRKEGTDSATVAWFVWIKSWSWAELGIKCPFQFITDWRE